MNLLSVITRIYRTFSFNQNLLLPNFQVYNDQTCSVYIIVNIMIFWWRGERKLSMNYITSKQSLYRHFLHLFLEFSFTLQLSDPLEQKENTFPFPTVRRKNALKRIFMFLAKETGYWLKP